MNLLVGISCEAPWRGKASGGRDVTRVVQLQITRDMVTSCRGYVIANMRGTDRSPIRTSDLRETASYGHMMPNPAAHLRVAGGGTEIAVVSLTSSDPAISGLQIRQPACDVPGICDLVSYDQSQKRWLRLFSWSFRVGTHAISPPSEV